MECIQISRKRKLTQLETTADTFALMLKREGYIAYKNGYRFENDEDIKNYINKKIDVSSYFGTENGHGMNCLRVSCNNSTGANFYKYKGITLYKCHWGCNCVNETISLFELILEVFKQQYKIMDYNIIMYKIKLMFNRNYTSIFYEEYSQIVEHNREMINNLHHRKYLYRLFKKRNLMDLYIDFTELALIYMREDAEIPYSFYCSNMVIKRTFKYVFNKPSSNYQIDKINLLVTLGLIEKLDEDNCGARMRAKIIKAKTIANKDKGYIKATNAYRMHKLTLDDINKAEALAKIILENKIYNVNSETIKEVKQQNKKDLKANETFVKRAKKAIKEELNAKGYIQIQKIASKIDKKGKYYKKEEKQKLLDENIKRIISDYKLEIILVNKNARKELNLTRSIKDDTEILIRKKTEISEKKKKAKDAIIVENCETINNKNVKYEIEDIDTSVVPF